MANYSILEDYARSIETRLQRAREDLAPLEGGRTRLGESVGGAPWVDITQRAIRQHKKIIESYERILKEIRAQSDRELE